ncbi:MAG: porin, partial [Gallionella sp.]
MQKKIIALAIASALTVPAVAIADSVGNVAMYGQVNLSLDRTNDGMATNSQTSNNMVNNSSRLGVAGSEDLGGGLAGVFQVEGEVDANNGTSGAALTFDRNTFLGLKSADFGTFLAGNYDTAYKASTRYLDLFADIAAADNRKHAAGLGKGHDVYRNNSLTYKSPSMSGFSVNASVAKAQAAAQEGGSFSLAGMYSMDNMMATLAYDKVKSPTVLTLTTAESKAVKLGGSYSIDAFKVNAVVEKLTSTPVTSPASTGDTTGTNWYLGGQYSLSETDAIKLAYAKKGDAKTAGAA